jgi:hypothetical protein
MIVNYDILLKYEGNVYRLLSVSVWGAQDVKRIQKAQRDIGKWKVKTF